MLAEEGSDSAGAKFNWNLESSKSLEEACWNGPTSSSWARGVGGWLQKGTLGADLGRQDGDFRRWETALKVQFISISQTDVKEKMFRGYR